MSRATTTPEPVFSSLEIYIKKKSLLGLKKVFLSGIKPDWSSRIRVRITLLRQTETFLTSPCKREMGRCDSGRPGSLPDFGINTITASLMDGGRVEV